MEFTATFGLDRDTQNDFSEVHVNYTYGENSCEIKIGFSKHPEIHRKQVQRKREKPVQILHIITSGDYEIEQELHLRFQMHRRDGEWVTGVHELLVYIEYARGASKVTAERV